MMHLGFFFATPVHLFVVVVVVALRSIKYHTYKISRIKDSLQTAARQSTLPLSIRINTASLYCNESVINYKRDKYNIS